MPTYGLPPDYISRSEPRYFDDVLDDSQQWQADVYRISVQLARKAGVKKLIDLGCGRGGKLIAYAKEFDIVGVDYGANLDAFAAQFGNEHFFIADLNTSILPSSFFKDAVVIAADVIEHLPTPDALIETLRHAVKTATYVLLSTPDRERLYNDANHSPPDNLAHVREWTNTEFENWLLDEGLPVRWCGWTISNDKQPNRVHTSLIVLSKNPEPVNMPITFQPALHWRKSSRINRDMLKVWMTPTPSEAGRDVTNSIHNIVCRLDKHLPDYGVMLVEQPDNADVYAAHAGQGSATPIHVAHYHGLYPTAQGFTDHGYYGINKNVIHNLKTAKIITAPSEWIADCIRRDMHINPRVIGWGVDTEEWQPAENPHVYVLWNKARVDHVCNPQPMLDLAAKAHDTLFLTTFGEGTPNVKTIGRQPYAVMKDMIRNAAVYLSTNVETFGIGVLEAMASGIPILGYRLDNTAQLVEHGVTGFLAEPGDLEGLYEGLRYCLKYRKRLGANAREAAKQHTWERVAKEFAGIYHEVLKPHIGAKVSVVIPCHNYAEYVGEALESVFNQKTNFQYEIILVLDRCTDNSLEVAKQYCIKLHSSGRQRGSDEYQYLHINRLDCLEVGNGNLSATRNDGIRQATGEYIVCLDADDRIGSENFLQVLSDGLDTDRTLGVVFTSITVMDANGNLGHKSAWPSGYDYDLQVQRRNQIPSLCMFRKEAWKRAGGFKPFFTHAEDAEFWLTVGSLGYGAKHLVDEGWFHYRLHNKSASQVHRTGEIPEPDWTEYHAFTRDNERPFASDGKAPLGSWPVRFYNEPQVTIIIPVGTGHERTLADALHSVEAQSFRYWECIVVNDTGKPLELDGFPFARLIDTKGAIGAGAARNAGAKYAKTPFLVFLDADDMLKPRFLEATLKAYTQHGRYAYTDWLTHEKQINWQVHPTPEYSFEAVWERPSIHPITCLIPRQWFERVGGFDETLSSFEDVDFFMKMLTHGFCGVRVAEPLLIYNLNSGKRRAIGRLQEDKFKALLKERYGAYMEGKEMCNCVEPPKGKQPQAPTEDNLGDYKEAYGDAVLAKLVGQFVGEAPAPFRGPATRTFYGRRAKGDVFLIWEADLLQGGDTFEKVENYSTEPPQTVIPPEPPMLEKGFARLEPDHNGYGAAVPTLDNEPEVEMVNSPGDVVVENVKPRNGDWQGNYITDNKPKKETKPRGKPGRKPKAK